MNRILSSLFTLCTAFVFASGAFAAPNVGVSTQFLPADSSRTAMDVGGVWNGSTEVTNTTGDTFTVTYNNTGTTPAYDFEASVTLPTGFEYVPGSASVSTTPGTPGLGVVASQAGDILTFALSPAGFDLPANTSITFTYGLRISTPLSSGTYQLQHFHNYALEAEGPLLSPAPVAYQQNQLVVRGDSILRITPNQQRKAVGEIAEFTVTVTNSGIGGLFDVIIDESAINPGNNLQIISFEHVAPALPSTLNGAGDVRTIPYLAPGESFITTVEAVVQDCGTIVNIANTNDRINSTSSQVQAPVELNFLQPLIVFDAPAISLNYTAPETVEIEFENTRSGAAVGFVLETTLNSLPVTISNVNPNWEYNSGDGSFTLLQNGGTIGDSATVVLTFDIEATDICSASGAGSVFYEAIYENTCGDQYLIPKRLGAVSGATDVPSITLAHGVSDNRISVNQMGSYTLIASAANIANISTDPIVVTEILPDQVEYVDHDASVGTVSVVGRTLTWTIPLASLVTPQTLDVDFVVVNDPCLAGLVVSASSSITGVESIKGCSLNTGDSVSFFISNNPDLFASQYFNVVPPAPDGFFETGDPSTNLTRDRGEGEFIAFEAVYEFGEGYPGTWIGSTYTDDFAGVAAQSLVPGSLTYTFEKGGVVSGPIAVPPSNVTVSAVGFSIDLSFLNESVEDSTLTLNYQTTISDSALAGAVRSLLQRTNLVLAEGGTGVGICGESAQNRFTQGAYYAVGRASASIGLSMPSVLDVCKEEILTITVDNDNAKNAYNTLVTLLNSGTEYDFVLPQTPVYGGVFNSGNINYSANGGVNPTFEYTGGELTGQGTIQVRVIRRDGNTVPSGFSARLDYDSYETEEAGARVYQSGASYAPIQVRRANLALNVTPGTIAVIGSTIQYSIFVTNTDAGIAYDSILENTLPVGVTIAEALTNAENPVNVQASGSDLSWSLGDIAPGETVVIRVVANVEPLNCSISFDGEMIRASWGCDSTNLIPVERTPPSFTFPGGRMQVVHDSTESLAKLCETGKVRIIVRNTGPTEILNIRLQEVIPVASTILIDLDSVRFSEDGGAWQSAVAQPSFNPANGTYEWTSTQIPALGLLTPQGGTGTQEIRIEFDITASEELASQNPQLTASADAIVPCGNAVNSNAQPFTLPIERPRINVTKTVRNDTAGSAFGNIAFGGQEDEIVWRVEIENTGTGLAQNVRIHDPLSGSNPLPGATRIVGPISGPGSPIDEVYTPGTWFELEDIPAGATVVYEFREILGDNCVDVTPLVNVTWGCISNPPNTPSGVSVPGSPQDSARISMDPVISGGTQVSQNITYLEGGRARIDVTVRNEGGNANNIVVTNNFPAGIVFDESVDAVLISSDTARIDGVTTDSTDVSSPVFTLTGPSQTLLRFQEEFVIRYFVRSNVFDTSFATSFPELTEVDTVANGRDPSPPATGTNSVRIDYTNSCGGSRNGTGTATINLRTPDLDITAVSSNNNLLSATTTQNYTFTVTNNGDANSVANNITLDFPGLGDGWEVSSIRLTTPGNGGVANADAILESGVYTFTPAMVGTLAQGSSAVVTLSLTYDEDNSVGSLRLLLRARGATVGEDGVTEFGNYSYDQRAQRVLGVKLVKEFQGSSEDDSTGVNVLIGEELDYRIIALFRGGEAPVSSVIVREQLRRGSGGSNNNNFGYVSHETTGNHNIGAPVVSATNNALTQPPVRSGRIDFTYSEISAAQMQAGAIFEIDLVARVMNIANNGNNTARFTRTGLQFTYLGETFRTNESNMEFNTGVNNPALYVEHQVTVQRPQLAITKQARNITVNPTGGFTNTVTGEAGDVIEYRLVVTNPASNNPAGQRPLYSIVVEDTVHERLNLSDSDAGAATTGSFNTVDVLNSAVTAGAGGTIIFDDSNTPIGIPGQDLARLDPGQSVRLLYRVTLEQSVVPSEALGSTVEVSGQSIPAPSGAQSLHPGTPGNTDGALVLVAEAETAVITVEGIEQVKEAVEFSSLPDNDSRVYIGEQIRYRITLELPQGTVPDFQVFDELPAGLALVETSVVSIGAGISDNAVQPVITPGSLPTSGSPLEISWDFGSRTSLIGSTLEERTVVIEYVAQVRNISSNVAGVVLSNNASYFFDGSPINIASASLTVAEPNVSVTKSVSPEDPVDAGDILTYTITVTNATGTNVAPAYDLNLFDLLPDGVTYIPDSTTILPATSGLPSPLVEPDVSGQELTWGREQGAPVKLDLGPGETLAFSYQVRVDDSSQPAQEYRNSIEVDWTSLDGAPGPDLGIPMAAPADPLGERTGSGAGPNGYSATAESVVNADNSTTIVKTHTGETLPVDAAGDPVLPPTAFRVGDIVTYTLTLDVQEAVLQNFEIEDVLPAGLEFVETISISPLNGEEGFVYTTPVSGSTAPGAGATGSVKWDFSTLSNIGDNDPDNNTLEIVYTAKILNDGANPVPPTSGLTNLNRVNSATVTFLDSGGQAFVSDVTSSGIIVSQPRLEITKARVSPSAHNIVMPLNSGVFRLTVTNTGTAPAYNLDMSDIIPLGMREAEPVVTLVTLNGANVLSDFQTPSPTTSTWDEGTGELAFVLSDDQFILPGQTFVVEYTFTIDEDAQKGSTLTNTATVNRYFGKPSVDTDERREYNDPVSSSQDIIVGMEIFGFVYNDIEPNAQRDGFEDWSDGPPVFVNLVDAGTGTVIRSTPVLTGPGDYVLTDIGPGSYRVIVTNTAVNANAQAPASWLFRMPLDGVRPVIMTGADRHDENFGLYQGMSVSGLVFRDTGGIANNGIREGGEPGISQVQVRLLNGNDFQVLGSTYTDGDGAFTLYIPDGIAPGTPLIVEQVNRPGYVSTGASLGNSGGAYDRDTDRISFVFNNVAITGLQFGDVPESALVGDGAQTIMPGGTAYYRHTFVAGTSGTVTFDTVMSANPSIPWSQVIVRDDNCDGQIDGAEEILNGIPISVTAGEEICLIVKDIAPQGAPYGATNNITVRANFVYDNATPGLSELLTRTDLTTIGSTNAAGLQLVKEVDKTTARPGELITYTITYTNAGAEELTDLFIDDRTPHYTTFESAGYEVPPANLDPLVIVLVPDVGEAGSIRWTFAGTLAPGSSGEVTFTVRVLP